MTNTEAIAMVTELLHLWGPQSEQHEALDLVLTAAQSDLVDLRLIAERLGVHLDTVNKWRHRRILPSPDYPQLRNPVWDWETIRQWAEQTGRLK